MIYLNSFSFTWVELKGRILGKEQYMYLYTLNYLQEEGY